MHEREADAVGLQCEYRLLGLDIPLTKSPPIGVVPDSGAARPAGGLMVESKGPFDEADYNRQLNEGFGKK